MDNVKKEMFESAERIVTEQLSQVMSWMNKFKKENGKSPTESDLELMGIHNIISTIENATNDLNDENGEVLDMMKRVTEKLNVDSDFQFVIMSPEEMEKMEAEEEEKEDRKEEEIVRQYIHRMSDDEIRHIIEVGYNASEIITSGVCNPVITKEGEKILHMMYNTILETVAWMIEMSGRDVDFLFDGITENERKENNED